MTYPLFLFSIIFEDYRYGYDDLSEYENKVFEVFDWNKAKAKDFNKEDDIYVVDKYFTWTYVNTHEREWCGPYFCDYISRSSRSIIYVNLLLYIN